MNTTEPLSPLDWRAVQAPADHWPKNKEFVCKNCLGPIHLNPGVPEIMGCPKCGITVRPHGYERNFKKIEEVKQ
jgi:hypothetical protein